MSHVGFERGARNLDSRLIERACDCANLNGIPKRGSRAMRLEGTGTALVLGDKRILNSDDKPPLCRSVRSGQTCARSVVLHPCRVDLKSSNFTHGQQDGYGALPATIPVSSDVKGVTSASPRQHTLSSKGARENRPEQPNTGSNRIRALAEYQGGRCKVSSNKLRRARGIEGKTRAREPENK